MLILFDADDDCPRECAPEFEAWAGEASRDVPCAVVMANREYEAWFLASIESLRDTTHIRADAVDHPEPERPRNAKGEMKKRMEGGRYLATVHQAPLTASFDLAAAYRRCRSFRRLVRAFGVLLEASDVLPTPWPPAEWTDRPK